MKNVMKKTIFITALTAMLALPAQAALLSVDWKVPGDGALTLDTKTGLKWLDFKYTKQKSFKQITELLKTDLSGFAIGTRTQVFSLLSSNITTLPLTNKVNQAFYSPLPQGTAPELLKFYQLFGNNTAIGGLTSVGLYLNDNPSDRQFLMLGHISYNEHPTHPSMSSTALLYNQGDYNADFSNLGIGFYLYQTASPVPATSGLLSVLGMGWLLLRLKSGKPGRRTV